MSLMGLDVGTTGCKAVVFDLEGKVLSQAYREYSLLHPRPGWVELNMNEVLRKVEESIQEASSKVKGDPIKALSISTQGEAFVPVDRKGNLLTNGPVSFDSRGEEFIEWWKEKLGPERIIQITGMPLHPMFTLNKVLWLKKNRADIYRKTYKLLCCEDLIIYKLGLPPTIDRSLASRTMAFDILKRDWSEEILSIAGVDRSLLPDVLPSGTVIGEIPQKIAHHLHLPPKVVVATGGHDQPCGALGAGVMKEGVAMDAIGTVECIACVFKEPHLDKKMLENNFACYPHVVPELYITLAFNFTGGSLLRWFRDTLGEKEKEKAQSQKEDVYSVLIDEACPDPSPLYVLPHFTTTGTPYMDTSSAGAILGLSLDTNKSEIIRAILEGVSFEMKHNLSLLEEIGISVEELRAIGGGARSRKWLQLKADLYGRKVVSLKVSEAASLGAAILAGVAMGEYSSVEEAVKTTVKIKETFYPQEKKTRIYEKKFLIYREIYPTLRELNHKIRDLQRNAS
ncbi:hypothetical protein DRJ00_08110 [Candidatus Aerophobetes bacterium]|uniref:Xylulokinase n=1 Tax=Aerophobetes bacterium TaxID=2030807 RepID=A0A497E1Y6_UNCAE|nr:MAG: hypothetical protein DRJ00_08110 [Candidatus Aerophobetes bacterium]